MFSIGLVVLISLDLILLTYGKYKFYYSALKKTIEITKEKRKKKLESQPLIDLTTNEIQEIEIIQVDTESKKGWIKKTFSFVLKWAAIIIVSILVLAIILITIGLTTASIWGTILLAIYKSFIYAASFLIGIKLFFFLLGLGTHKLFKVDKSVTQRVLIMDTIQFSMLAILLYFAAFGFPLQVTDMVTIPFDWNITFNNFASIMVPMVFFSLIIVNVLSLAYRLKNIITKDREKHKLIRLHQLLFIFIAACYVGILYITDIELDFMSELELTMYLETLEVVKWMITSVFIPLFIYTLNQFNKGVKKES
ncbi:MAG: hypothetical protein K9L02_03145 [Acholeplasmataceae bacterium]|nr:hypothetical protein [Acholeplasmataceae bacterium]